MAKKRSIFIEVGAEEPVAAPKVQITPPHSRAAAYWCFALALILSAPFASGLLPLMGALLLKTLAPMAAVLVFALGWLGLGLARKLPRGAGGGFALMGGLIAAPALVQLALTEPSIPQTFPAVLPLLAAPWLAPLVTLAGLGALALSLWSGLTHLRAPSAILAARRGAETGLSRAALALAAVAGLVLLAPALTAYAALTPALPLAILALPLALLARRSALRDTRGSAYLAVLLALIQGVLAYLIPALALLPLVQLAAFCALIRAAHRAQMPLKQDLRG